MLRIQPPPSMPSTSASSYKLNGTFPSLRQQDFAWPWEKNTCARGGHDHTPPLGFTHRSDYKHGLRTPPKDMNASDGNPLLAQNGGGQSYKRVPAVGSSNYFPHNPQTTADNSRVTSNREPFYRSYYSVKGPQSPVPAKKETAAQIEQTARRRASSDNSIASHLQIPATINNSKGSLPEFAAQVSPSAISYV